MSGDEDDSKLQEILKGLKTWTDEEREKYCDELDHPLFETGAVPASNEVALALSNIAYDEVDTAESMARDSKERGNTAFGQGAAYYGNAIKHYNDAIRHAQKSVAKDTTKAADREEMTRLLSVCWSNLAAIYLARTKYITVLDCVTQALKYWPGNVKAVFRAAKACMSLGRADAALQFAGMGKGLEPANAAFPALEKEARELLARQERIRRQTEAEAASKAASLAAVRAACKERNLRVGPPLFSGMKRTLADPYVDEHDCVHWPVVILYPEYGQSDYVEDVSEVTAVGDVVSMVLPEADAPPAARLPWDERREYVAANCDIFFKSNPCKPLPSLDAAWTPAVASEKAEDSWKASRFIRVPPAAPLLLALVHESYIIADIPVFHCVARSSTFYAEMKKAAGGTFAELRMPAELERAMEAPRE